LRQRSGRVGAGITRRRFLGAVPAGAGLVALAGTLGCERSSRTRSSAAPRGSGEAGTFRSRSDLRPPAIAIHTGSSEAAPGHVFVSPKHEPGGRAPSQDALLILDNSGESIWFHPPQDAEMDVFDFEEQQHKGEPVLATSRAVRPGDQASYAPPGQRRA